MGGVRRKPPQNRRMHIFCGFPRTAATAASGPPQNRASYCAVDQWVKHAAVGPLRNRRRTAAFRNSDASPFPNRLGDPLRRRFSSAHRPCARRGHFRSCPRRRAFPLPRRKSASRYSQRFSAGNCPNTRGRIIAGSGIDRKRPALILELANEVQKDIRRVSISRMASPGVDSGGSGPMTPLRHRRRSSSFRLA